MNDEQFEKGLKKYRELTLEIEKEKEEIKSDDITKLYHEEVEQKLYDDINDLVQSRFSEEGYFILHAHKKSFTVAVYSDYAVGLKINIRSYSFPNYKNSESLKTQNLLHNAKFEVSSPYEVISYNLHADDNDSIPTKISELMIDMVNNFDAKFYKSGLHAAMDNGFNAASETGQTSKVGYGKGTLTINKLSNLDYFLGGFSAIVEGELSKSSKNKNKYEKHERHKRYKKITLILIILLVATIFIFA